ncbi:GNAT family N-acetyltransferase [Novosphingobium sp. Leaf2]|uniref:GNAT family N-acetyltransferase n=1 Tax=Novosphingobium sp. Leaf2 TaxID=1735670 RepID=UPI0006F1F3B4|nr:GNAT family N-acetyltransferase [Novosphingobium sp. Leaf2]KQM18325.1 GCN5 family acetyltransferase [Novosphingobium sp. Leaf2]
MFVRTERLFLRPGWPEDLDELVEALGCDVRHNAGVALPPTRLDAMRLYLDAPREPCLPRLLMYLRAPCRPKLVGGIGLARNQGEIEISYWITEQHRGRGFVGEALRAVVGQARTLGYPRVVTNDFAEQVASREALESAGFRDTGKLRVVREAGRAIQRAARIYVADLAGSAQRPATWA